MPKGRVELTAVELAFIVAYTARDSSSRLDPVESGRAAGLSEATARSMLRRKRVLRAIDRRLAKRVAGPAEVLGEISEIAMASPESLVKVVVGTAADGSQLVASARLDMGPKTRMLELLARHYGHALDPLQRKVGLLIDHELAALGAGQKQKRKKARRLAEAQRASATKRRLLAPGDPGGDPLDMRPSDQGTLVPAYQSLAAPSAPPAHSGLARPATPRPSARTPRRR